MSRLPITIATWDYDRVRALIDGRVQVEGCDVNYITMPVEELFERAFFHGEFEVAEIGFSPFLIALSRGPMPYVALPVFLSRMFRHSAVYIRSDRGIEGAADLRGKRIGCPNIRCPPSCGFAAICRMNSASPPKISTGCRPGWKIPGAATSSRSLCRKDFR